MNSDESSDHIFDGILEEYLTKRDLGESPDQQEYISQYPNYSDQLSGFFNDMLYLDTMISDDHQTILEDCKVGNEEVSNEINSSILWKAPILKGYRLIEEIGGGSQGTVYRAVQEGTKRIVALKVIHEGTLFSNIERRRFENEVELASKLKHQNIVSIYSFGQDRGRAFFAMEYVDGEPLDIYLDTCILTVQQTLTLFEVICEAINYAHRNGVIHRDLKPSNIIIDKDGHAHIVDFGLAKLTPIKATEQAPRMTVAGEFAGTWHYASPEQVKRDSTPIDTQSDLYTLGVLLYEMLTDTFPYPIQDESRDVIAQHILETAPIPPSSYRSEIDNDIDTITLRVLHKDPEKRYHSVFALKEDINRYLAGEAIEAKRDSTWYVLSKTIRKYKWRVAAIITSFIFLLVFAITSSILYKKAQSSLATTEVRARIARDSQTYVTDKLEEFNLMSNTLMDIMDSYDHLPQIDRIQKNVEDQPLVLFDPIVKNMPANIYEVMLERDHPEYDSSLDWLQFAEPDLARIEDISRTHRYSFEVSRTSNTSLVIDHRPVQLQTVEKICQALLAKAVYHYREGQHESAVSSLNAVRSIAIDLSNGRLLHHKIMSVIIRSRTYDLVLLIFGRIKSDFSDLWLYYDWALNDPHLTRYRLAMIPERIRLSQLCEQASLGTKPGDEGYLNIQLLDKFTSGLYNEVGLLSENAVQEHKISPRQAINAIDDIIHEVELWDSLNVNELRNRSRSLSKQMKDSEIFTFLRPLFANYPEVFHVRGRASSKRSATILSAYLTRFYSIHKYWPDRLDDFVPSEAYEYTIDPYTGESFRYILDNGQPLLYSINEDLTDNGGMSGNWGVPYTDVVLFTTHPS